MKTDVIPGRRGAPVFNSLSERPLGYGIGITFHQVVDGSAILVVLNTTS